MNILQCKNKKLNKTRDNIIIREKKQVKILYTKLVDYFILFHQIILMYFEIPLIYTIGTIV